MTRLFATWYLALAVAFLVGPSAAIAQPAWSIESYDVVIEVEEDASFTVTEVIAVDFGTLERHGIYREIPVRYELPPSPPYELPDPDLTPSDYQRAIEIDDIRVRSSSAPDDVEVTRPGPVGGEWVRIRIGDPDRTISGRHTYSIHYRVRGAFDRFDGAPELFWDVTGNDWEAPIERVSAVVTGPAPSQAGCFRGVYATTGTCESRLEGGEAVLRTRDLTPGEGMTIAVRYPDQAVDVPPPLLEARWDLGRAFVGSGWSIPLTVLTALVAFAAVGMLLFRQGRDRVARGTVTVDGRVDRGGAVERRRGLFEPRVVPVRFRPPDGLRPGQLGLIVDERVDEVDVSATIVDLAVRGHLRIEEIEDTGVLWMSRSDWRLVRTDPAERDDVPADLADRELLRYEQLLLDGLFRDGDSVRISDLKGEFHEDYADVELALYHDGNRRRWFANRPDRVRNLWLAVGIGATLVAIGVLVAAVIFTTLALAVVPLVVAGLVLAIGHRAMPHRTVRGSALLTDALGFREFIATAEADRLRFAEAEDLFLPYLPYAVVFGATERWAKAFADLGIEPPAASGWYVGPGPFHAARFSSGLSEFSSSVGSSLATVPTSSGSGGFSGGGFSGGGFGGGGGGSW